MLNAILRPGLTWSSKPGAALPHFETGKLRALDVTSDKRSSTLPEVALAEALQGLSIVSWQAIFAPAGVPQPVVASFQAS